MKKGMLFIPYLKGYGGTETVIDSLLREFDSYDENEVLLKTYSIGGTEYDKWLDHKNVSKIKYPSNKLLRQFLYILLLPFTMLFIIKKNNPDFVISTTPIMWFIAKLISNIFGYDYKVIAWYHYSYDLKPVKKIFLRNADVFFTISKAGKSELISIGISPQKIFVIYNPVIPTEKVITHTKNNNKFIYVGRTEFSGQKNISELFYALSNIKNRHWKLFIYGIGPDKDNLVKLSKKLGISNNINWMGFRSNVFDEISEGDALILTSKYEGFSMVIAEAISHGLIAISSDCPSGPAELINEQNGKLYNPGDVNQLADIINEIIDKKMNFKYDTVKNSISRLYIERYFSRFIEVIKVNVK